MKVTAQELLAGLALVIMGVLAVSMTLDPSPVPAANHDYMLIILGALGGALGVTGGQRVADKITNSTGADAVISTGDPK